MGSFAAAFLSRPWPIVFAKRALKQRPGFPQFSSSNHVANGTTEILLDSLRQLDTASLCDADKMMRMTSNNNSYQGIRLLSNSIRPIGGSGGTNTMAGIARTVQCTQPNDFLAVLRGLLLASLKENILMVDTNQSDRAVAGELFCMQAIQKGLAGIVVDGPMRDTNNIRQELQEQQQGFRCYATSTTPYAGTTNSPGNIGVPIVCGGVFVENGDVVVGDDDGIVVGKAATFATLLAHAQAIVAAESEIKKRIMLHGESLADVTNAEEHIAARLAGDQSSLAFTI